jgi:hypothetical protein
MEDKNGTQSYKKQKDIREFIASSELFSDYRVTISLFNVSTIEDILTIFKKSLVSLFHENHLSNLEKIAKDSHFHIHTHTIEDILTSNEDDIFYICDHC